MREEPLYIMITRKLVPGDQPRTAHQIAVSCDRSEQQAKKGLDWMSNTEVHPTMAEVPDSSPKQWVRIARSEVDEPAPVEDGKDPAA